MPTLTFDIDTLTLRELMEAERQSGMDGMEILNGKMSRLILVVFVQQWRTSGTVPSWSEAADRRVLDALSSISG